jgi:site-specific recombinase XerC
MRSQEVTTLTKEHVNIQGNSIKAIGKGGRERVIPMTLLIAEALKQHLAVLKVREHDNPTLVFPSTISGKPLTDMRRGIEFAKKNVLVLPKG